MSKQTRAWAVVDIVGQVRAVGMSQLEAWENAGRNEQYPAGWLELRKDYRTNGAAAVRFAPSSAYWSNELRRLFGDDARTGIEVLENRHRQEQDRAERLAEALRWYAEQAAGCRKIGRDGDAARAALDADGGGRARATLEQENDDA